MLYQQCFAKTLHNLDIGVFLRLKGENSLKFGKLNLNL